VYDAPLFVVLIFHIIEWIRQTVLITTILVGVKWLPVYYGLTINLAIFFVAVIWGMAAGFGSPDDCQAKQAGRADFLKVQLITLFVYLFWFALPAVVCKIGDAIIKPSEDEDGKPIYGSWTHE